MFCQLLMQIRFRIEGETHLFLNIIKDLDINRFLDMCKYHNDNLISMVVEEGGVLH